ncbi:hypothetical protein CVU76_01780 [Candidatus Dojkabacteria bacterium HGW-Dojkabacteria-1]|uniref:Uncharacterized protein n=1 Tax=Candidatus Dojkabacteria bacterium HGW-Dojkabacteria-1 TaxID=2013761 RepID=A0A2N2F3F1_9BACT|nr:MAG: hypothetical protein CVU76_01780 [Candidatus Dojkabacteria bacterium HGW-Dojkabacteria-1]
MDKEDNILNNPNKFVLVVGKEEILEAYSELFDVVNVDILPFYIEKLHDNTVRAHRLVITPSGIVAIASEDKDVIWEMNFETEEGIHLLEESNRLSAQTESRDIHDLIPVIETEQQTYYLRLLPYFDQRASAVLIDILDQKYAAYNLE